MTSRSLPASSVGVDLQRWLAGALLLMACGSNSTEAVETDGPSDSRSSSSKDSGAGTSSTSDEPRYEGGYHEVTCDGEPVVHQGKLIISEGTDPESLACLVEITGGLRIEDTTTWPDLQPLSRLKAIGTGWDLDRSRPYVGDALVIRNNSFLRALRGLDRLENVAEGISVEANPTLGDLAGLGAVRALGALTIRGNGTLGSVRGLQGRITVPGAFQLNVYGNPNLRNLDGFLAIEAFDRPSQPRDVPPFEAVRVQDNPALEDTSGIAHLWQGAVNTVFHLAGQGLQNLAALRNVTDAMEIQVWGTVLLTDLSDLGRLERIHTLVLGGCSHFFAEAERESSGWYWADNVGLRSLKGLEGLRTVVGLRIVGNPNLTDVSALRGATVQGVQALGNRALSAEQEAVLRGCVPKSDGGNTEICDNGAEACRTWGGGCRFCVDYRDNPACWGG